jgi:hypothetical protein
MPGVEKKVLKNKYALKPSFCVKQRQFIIKNFLIIFDSKEVK